MLPIIASPVEDELLSSYIHRLVKLNLLDVASFNDMFGFTKTNLKRDSTDYLLDFLEEVSSGTELDFFYAHTIFSGLFPLMDTFSQTKVIAQCFYRTPLPHGVNPFFSADRIGAFHVCPECYEEEKKNGRLFGEHTLYRSHQMPGVRVCYRHGSVLRKLSKNRLPDRITDISMLPPVVSSVMDEEAEKGYAIFCHDLLNMNIMVHVKDTVRVIARKLRQDYSASLRKDDPVTMKLISDCGCMFSCSFAPVPVQIFLQDNRRSREIPEQGLRFTYMLFRTAEAFRDAVSSTEGVDGSAVLTASGCPECGRLLVNSAFSRRFGFPCACTLPSYTADSYAEHIAQSAAGSRYDMEFWEEQGNYHVRYTDSAEGISRCGTLEKMLQHTDSLRRHRASAGYEELLRRNHDGRFSFVRMDKESGKCVIRCRDCGEEFPYEIHSYQDIYPIECPVCREEKMREVIGEMYGNEYQVVEYGGWGLVLRCSSCHLTFVANINNLEKHKHLICPMCRKTVTSRFTYKEARALFGNGT